MAIMGRKWVENLPSDTATVNAAIYNKFKQIYRRNCS
jgi:hypothetical protein